MSLGIATHQTRAYRVTTPVYEGPLDLLLQLIERAELDITKLALAQVTDQYLVHLETVQQRVAGEVSAFLVIAARLVQIKSEALLPHPPERETREEDPGESLAQQLAVYKRYKEIALGLGKREARGLHTYIRLAVLPKISGKVELNGVGLSDLVTSAARVFSVPEAKTPLKTVVSAPKVTIREKIRLIVDAIRSQGWVRFFGLLRKARSRLEIVVSFLALLELIKLRRVSVQQETLFEDIVINPAEAWSDDEDFELEFGE